jgi:hypothetical protein
MTRKSEHMMTEADIGSGEKKPADVDTQKMIEEIPDADLNSSVQPEKPAKNPPTQHNSA